MGDVEKKRKGMDFFQTRKSEHRQAQCGGNKYSVSNIYFYISTYIGAAKLTLAVNYPHGKGL